MTYDCLNGTIDSSGHTDGSADGSEAFGARSSLGLFLSFFFSRRTVIIQQNKNVLV
jgi:hypothetical protein